MFILQAGYSKVTYGVILALDDIINLCLKMILLQETLLNQLNMLEEFI